MNETLSIVDLENRWEKSLMATEALVVQYPETYREIKSLVKEVVTRTLDIGDYLPTAERLVSLMQEMDAVTADSIFHFFREQFSPTSIGKLKLFRFECMDLYELMKAFDAWRLKSHHLEVIK